MTRTDHPKIFVGWDCGDERAFDVCLYAIQSRASDLVEIVPLKPKSLPAVNGGAMSGNCATARFHIPSFMGFAGWALFVSNDMLVQTDIYDLWQMRDDRYAVMSVDHNGAASTRRTDADVSWSSLVLWNCGHVANRALDPARLRDADPHWLAGFGWLDESQIGRLPEEWNWREGWSDPSLTPKIIEFAAEQPWHREPGRCAVADRWHSEARRIYGDLHMARFEGVAASQV